MLDCSIRNPTVIRLSSSCSRAWKPCKATFLFWSVRKRNRAVLCFFPVLMEAHAWSRQANNIAHNLAHMLSNQSATIICTLLPLKKKVQRPWILKCKSEIPMMKLQWTFDGTDDQVFFGWSRFSTTHHGRTSGNRDMLVGFQKNSGTMYVERLWFYYSVNLTTSHVIKSLKTQIMTVRTSIVLKFLPPDSHEETGATFCTPGFLWSNPRHFLYEHAISKERGKNQMTKMFWHPKKKNRGANII